MSAEIPSAPKTIDHVDTDTLQSHGIDLTLWGTGSAKTLNHLNAELKAGETLLISEEGRLVRFSRILGVDVCCSTDDGMRLLREARQEFTGGRMRTRALPTSLGEKLTPDEDAIAGVRRALSEELGISEILNIGKISDESRERESESFPGILTRSVIHNYAVLIDKTAYNAAGYVECQADKSTFFEWI